MKSSDGVDAPQEARPDVPQEEWTIGELAEHFGLATHVLRHWESMGLLTPARRVNGRRRYTRAHLARVGMILRGKRAALSLEEVRRLVAAPDGPSRREVLGEHLKTLDRRMAEIQASKHLIEHVLQCRYADFTECPRFQAEMERFHQCEREQAPAAAEWP